MGSPAVIATSALLFLPATVAFVRQAIPVAIVYFGAALFSTLYHSYGEQRYADMDVMWASLAVLVGLVVLALLAARYAFWNWRILVPALCGLAGVTLFFISADHGDDEEDGVSRSDNSNYEILHSIWHGLMTVAGIALLWTPVKLGDIANMSYVDLGRAINKNRQVPFLKGLVA